MNESYFYYKDAQKLAQKAYRSCVSKGQSPFLPVLDDIVSSSDITSGIDLGIVQIPAELIVGTKTRGRVSAFANNYMPILDETTEFAEKWSRLCEAHLSEGIREPIKAYEYLNRFYVEEGNKRASVLKFFDALTIPGRVIRIMPKGEGEVVELYNEFVEFYKLSKINYCEFSKKGSYAALQKLMGKEAGEEWTQDEQNTFAVAYYHFQKAYKQSGGEKLQSTVGDALLSYIQIYGYPELRSTDTDDIKKNLRKMWEEVELHAEETPIEVKTDPPEEKKQGVISKMLSAAAPAMPVGFIHDGTPEKSGWVNDHEKGRKFVQRVFDDKIETHAYYNAMENDEPLEVIEQAIADGCKLIFTTSPRLTQASLRAAVDHPDVIIMNCSLNRSHRYISVYYTRMYEAKFILGAIAGSLTDNDKIGYVCDYPIYGQIAGINAFALGAQMANPRAQVYLEWSSVDSANAAAQKLLEQGIQFISSQDTARFREDDRDSFGLSYINGDHMELIANPVWKWGVYYEKILRRVLSKTLQSEYESSNKAINYYWGMSAGVVDVVFSPWLTQPSKHFGDFLKEAIIHNVCTPFITPIYTQSGDKIGEGEKSLSLDQIIEMDYLVENVIGTIPQYEELTPMGKATVDTAGIEPAQSPALTPEEDENTEVFEDSEPVTAEPETPQEVPGEAGEQA